MAESPGENPVTESGSMTQTVVLEAGATDQLLSPTLSLRRPPESRPRVQWSADTVDNEGMGKKKSKCCCIYEKPKVFGESSSSSSDDSDDDHGCTPNCRGHKKKCFQHHKHPHGAPSHPHGAPHPHNPPHGNDLSDLPGPSGSTSQDVQVAG